MGTCNAAIVTLSVCEWLSCTRGFWPDLFSEEGTATALDHIQVRVHLVSTVNGQI